MASPPRKARTADPAAPPAGEHDARIEVVATAQAMSRKGLSPGKSGNVSRRFADGMLVTPTGVAYDTLAPADIVAVAADGTWSAHGLAPSSEWRFHLAAYSARPDIAALVHTHSLKATVLACAHRPIPAFHYMVAVAGGKDIPLVPYATFGTEELSRHVAAGLTARNACLMANHGQIAAGATLAEALVLAEAVETLAAQFVEVLALGTPHILSDAEMAEVLGRFASYGQQPGRT